MPDLRDTPPAKPIVLLEDWVPRLLSREPAEAEHAGETLAAALSADDESLRDRAARVLLRALGRDQPALDEIALQLLQVSWFPPAPAMAAQAVQAVLGALPRLPADSAAITDAALLLGNLCRVAPEQLAAVTAALGHDHPAIRQAAAGALGRAGEDAAGQCPALIRMLDDAEPAVVDAALESLCALAALAPAATAPALLRVIQTQAGHRRYQALAALRGLLEEARLAGRPSAKGLDDGASALTEAIVDGDAATRLEAAVCLGLLGAGQAQAAAALHQRLADAEPEVAGHAAAALLRLNSAPKEALARLDALLHDPDPARQQAALSALEGLESAVLGQAGLHELLIKASHTAPDEVRQAILEILQPGR